MGFFCNSFSNFWRRASIASVFVTIFSWQASTIFKEACATAGYFSLEPLLTAAMGLAFSFLISFILWAIFTEFSMSAEMGTR